MKARDVRFPDGSVFVLGTDADIEKYGQCLVALGDMLGDDDELLRDHESEVLDCLQRYYPKTSREDLRSWFDTSEIYPPEVMATFVQVARSLNKN